MGTPASLLELIARGSSMRAKDRAQIGAYEANIRQSDAEIGKIQAESKDRAQSLLDDQVIAEAFRTTDRTPAAMDAFIRSKASGKGIMRWEKHRAETDEHIARMDEVKLKNALSSAQMAGGLVSSVEKGRPYAEVYPELEALVGKGKIPTPDQFTPAHLPQMYAAFQYTENQLKEAEQRAKIKQTEAATAKSLQDAVLAQRAGFLQALRPDMSAEEFAAARAAFPEAAKQFPAAPGQWIKGAVTEAIAAKDRSKAEQDARVLGGMSPTGITAEQQAKLAGDEVKAKLDRDKATEDIRHHKALESAAATAAKVANANTNAQREGMLRDDFSKESKVFTSIRDAYGKIEKAAESPSAASDVALIYAFMRILDPTSTVREGEFATAQNAGGWPDRIQAMYNRARNGERLSDDIRKDFVGQAKKLYGQAEQDHSKTEKFYGDVAKRYGMNPKEVLPDYRTTFKSPTDKPVKDLTDAEIMERLK